MIKNLLILFSLLNPSVFSKRETDRLPEIHVIDKQTNHTTESGHRRGRNKTRKLTHTAVTHTAVTHTAVTHTAVTAVTAVTPTAVTSVTPTAVTSVTHTVTVTQTA